MYYLILEYLGVYRTQITPVYMVRYEEMKVSSLLCIGYRSYKGKDVCFILITTVNSDYRGGLS